MAAADDLEIAHQGVWRGTPADPWDAGTGRPGQIKPQHLVSAL